MTTTYELYTNENGTPKAVEGKAPAILERVEALETSVETLEEKSDDCLPKTGGEMSGGIAFSAGQAISKSTDEGALILSGGKDFTAARITVFGKSHASTPGRIALISADSSNATTFGINPDGTATLGGNEVFTSAGGILAGVIEIDRDTGHIYKKNASGRMIVRGGTGNGADGSSIYLNGKDYADNPSGFQVRIADGTNDKSLNCKPNGTFTWDGKNVVRSVNGTSADASGNVTLDSGGWKQVSSATLTISNTIDNTVTLSGLTSDRPVILKFYAQNGSYGYPRKCYARIKSGLIAGPISGTDGSGGSNSTSNFPYVVNSQVAKNTNPTFISSYPLLATGTSCSLILQTSNAASNAKYKITITAYQW